MLDVIIIGAGPAGYSAALYLARKKMDILVLSSDFGGQMSKASNVENYPGFDSISGPDLAEKFKAQVEKLSVKIEMAEVKKITKIEGGFEVEAASEQYQTKSIILASGKTPRKLGVKGETEFAGKGVGYCATCDGPLYHDKTVAVIGGANSALDAALEMEKYAKKVYILNLNEALQGDEIMKDRFNKSEKSELLNSVETKEIFGDKFVTGLKYEKVLSDEKAGPRPASPGLEITCEGIFIEIGWAPATEIVADLVKLSNLKEVEVDANMATSCEGIFAAGDVTNGPFKQIVISAGDGANAALSCWKYVITHK